MRIFLILTLFFLVLGNARASQVSAIDTVSHNSKQNNPQQLVLIKTAKNQEIIGYIFHQTLDEIHIKTISSDTVIVDWKLISSIQTIKKENINERNVYLPPNPQSSKYFLSPTGYGLKSGEVIIESGGLLFNHVNIGVTDFLSVQLGAVPFSLFTNDYMPVWIMPKLSIPLIKNKLNFGLGAFLSKNLWDFESRLVSYGLGTMTLGSRNSNVSFSLGYGQNNQNQNQNNFIFILSSMTRLNSKTYIMTENYYIPGESLILSFGARSFSGKVGVDYGIIAILESSGAILPWLGFSVPLGKQK